MPGILGGNALLMYGDRWVSRMQFVDTLHRTVPFTAPGVVARTLLLEYLKRLGEREGEGGTG